ncbi:DUF6979 family protein [Shewanella surugensis]|uniref:Uncharacterized protein n=1 Tax=Shewanella surugensis TaxID=212020 RepID=A0ABT0L6U3_9GAMM|nr:hypothetical protein [Shewanella surugensis]MCL1123422.1 hypothetical protein [Shewanella surugensis]
MDRVMFRVNLNDWLEGTIIKVKNNECWNTAWLETYKELGGQSVESGKKSCPKNAARILYQSGRLKGHNKPYKNVSFKDVKANDSVNGVYALMAIEQLKQNDSIELSSLVKSVHENFKKQFGTAPNTDQGAIKLTFKLWHLNKIFQK